MYYGRQSVGIYDPLDTKSAQWGGSTVGRQLGTEMDKASKRVEEQDAQAAAEHNRQVADSYAQGQHERSLQSQEQQRRMYDSQSARMGQQQKYGLLSGLLGGGMGIGGVGRSIQFGDIPDSERRRRGV